MAIKEICCLIWTTFMLATVLCSPTSRPLEHSPSDLAWDDWLQQGSRQAAPPRRITTKSLFVFPNLGAESLPACADGYHPDPMGRCVKIVKVDENAHLQFILDKLNSQFATDSSGQDEVYDYEGLDTESSEGSGPFQLSIPIAQQQIKEPDPEPDEPEGSGDVIILQKKEPPVKLDSEPTSSPEIVPEYVNSESIYLDNAASILNLETAKIGTNNSGVSILPSNKTDSGLTMFVSSNGKYGNVTTQQNPIKNETDLIIQLQNIKNDAVDVSSEHNTATVMPENADLKPSATNEDLKIKNITLETKDDLDKQDQSTIKVQEVKKGGSEEIHLDPIQSNAPSETHQIEDAPHTTEAEIKIAEMLVKEIETLKQQVTNKILELKQQNNEVHIKTNIQPDKSILNDPKDQPLLIVTDEIISSTTTKKPLNLNDIEEKIKRISLFADVKTNSESRQKLEAPHYDRFPQENHEDLIPNFSDIKHYLPHSYPAANFQRIPLSAEEIPNKNGYYGAVQEQRPYWWPSNGWPVDNQPNEENFRDYWSKGPTIPSNPFGVRYNGDYHRASQPLLYPNIHERDRISVRQASINHRRGREGRHRKRQIQTDENRYEFKKSPKLLEIMQTYDGR